MLHQTDPGPAVEETPETPTEQPSETPSETPAEETPADDEA